MSESTQKVSWVGADAQDSGGGLAKEIELFAEVQKQLDDLIGRVHQISDRIAPRPRENALSKIGNLKPTGGGLYGKLTSRRESLLESLRELHAGLAEVENML